MLSVNDEVEMEGLKDVTMVSRDNLLLYLAGNPG